jgi:Rod binding domain-containing protein
MDVSSSMYLDPTAAIRNSANADLSLPLASGNGSQDVGQNFESLFVSMLLKEMRQTSSEDGLFAGDTSDVYGGLFDMFLGQHIAAGGGFGIAELVNSQLKPASSDKDVATLAGKPSQLTPATGD